ncbi:hypothetical protein BJV78DRAFT_472211 [Lactifluus subvellereus]|nr:hypothetical protein BJV78DRAFT_472211 [Lactifluus subvellereus]
MSCPPHCHPTCLIVGHLLPSTPSCAHAASICTAIIVGIELFHSTTNRMISLVVLIFPFLFFFLQSSPNFFFPWFFLGSLLVSACGAICSYYR